MCGCDSITYSNSCVAYNYHGVTAWRQGPCTNMGGCQANYVYNIGIFGPTVFFTDQSVGSPTTWQWNFGDGTTSNQQNPSHIFPHPGKYAVCLTVSSAGSFCNDTYCDTVFVPGCVDSSLIDPNAVCPVIYAPVCGCDSVTYRNKCVAESKHGITTWRNGVCPSNCKADFVVAYPTGNNTIYFFDNSTGNYTNVIWDFGDGATSTDRNPEHEYNVTGWYNVCLTILNPSTNCYDRYCDSVFATGCINPAIVDSNAICPLIYAPVCGCDSVTYSNSCIAQSQGGVTSWTQGPCHPPCQASFSWLHCIDCPEVFFTNNSTGIYNKLRWDFGDGETSKERNPQHTYTTTGTYYVCLTVWNTFTNCYDTFCDSVLASGCVDSSLINNQPCTLIYAPVLWV